MTNYREVFWQLAILAGATKPEESSARLPKAPVLDSDLLKSKRKSGYIWHLLKFNELMIGT